VAYGCAAPPCACSGRASPRENVASRPRPCSRAARRHGTAVRRVKALDSWAEMMGAFGPMDLELRDKVAVVSGGSRGIGRSIARSLALEGCDCLIASRTAADLQATAETISAESGRRIETCPADLRTVDGCEKVHGAIERSFGRLDILINNAGATKRGKFLELDDATWEDGFALKFYACVRLSRLFWPMLTASKGVVANVIGGAARTPAREFMIGGSVNSAMANFTKALADQGLQDDVNVNAVYPGLTQTDRANERFRAAAQAEGVSLEEVRERTRLAEGVRRIGLPEDVGDLVAYLCSPKARHVHGTAVGVDGGSTAGLH